MAAGYSNPVRSSTFMRSRYIFAMLVLLHVSGFLFPPGPFASFIGNSVYLPLTLLKVIGLPVYASAQAWGWASPSPFGWLAVIIVWGLIWWQVASLAAWALRKA